MIAPGRMQRRRWMIPLLGLIAVGGVALAWPRRDPWPPRVVIRPPTFSAPGGFAVDGRAFVTIDRNGQLAWDLATGKPRGSAALGLRHVSTAPDGRTLVGVTGEERASSAVVVVEVASGRVVARFPLLKARALSVLFTDEGRSVRAVVVERPAGAEVVTWDIASGTATRRAVWGPHGDPQAQRFAPQLGDKIIDRSPQAIAPDGRIWAYRQRNPDGVLLWNSDTDQPIGNLLAAPAGGWTTAAFAPDGRTLIIGGSSGEFQVWDWARQRLVRTFRVDAGGLLLGWLGVAPDGRTLASVWMRPARVPTSRVELIRQAIGQWIPLWQGTGACDVVLSDLASGRTLRRAADSMSAMFAPDGRTIVTFEPDGTFAVRAMPDPKPPAQ